MGSIVKPHHWTILFSAAVLIFGFAAFMPPALAASIADTKHNLGSTGTGINHATNTAEICLFCHMPVEVDSTGAPLPPLWNKLLPTNTVYSTYASLQSGSISGTIGKPGGNSLECLSCHDGAQAMDNVINFPGLGVDPTGGGAAGRGFTWVGNRQANGKLINVNGSLAVLGTDLRDDHPIGIEYCGGPRGGAIGTCKDSYYVRRTAGMGGNMATARWWVDPPDGINGVREATDMPLYAAAPDRTTGIGPQVECGSCHDPHSTNALFLRRIAGNRNSITCLSCHVK